MQPDSASQFLVLQHPLLTFVLALIGALSGIYAIANGAYWLVRAKILRNALSTIYGDRSFTIVAPGKPSEDGVPNRSSTYEDAMALGAVLGELSTTSQVARTVLHDEVGSTDLEADIVVLCGPEGNNVSKKLFDEYVLPFEFQRRCGRWGVVRPDRPNARWEFDEKNHEDYAIVISAPNPWVSGRQRRLVFAAGIHGVGTWGGALALTKHAKFTVKFHQMTRSQYASQSPYFGAVVRVQRRPNKEPEVKLIEAMPINELAKRPNNEV